MKKTTKRDRIAKSEFYKLDSSKPIVVEGRNSHFPLVLLLFALFFCGILAFIVIVNVSNGSYSDSADTYKPFYIICGVLLGLAVIVFVVSRVKLSRIKRRLLDLPVTFANVTDVVITQRIRRDKDKKRRIQEKLSLYYEFYDLNGNLREEHYLRTYNGRAPEFFKGQKLAVAFDGNECFILSKFTLLDFNCCEEEISQSDTANVSGEVLSVDESSLVPLGVDKRFYVYSLAYFCCCLVFAALFIGVAVMVQSYIKWYFACVVAIFILICAVSALYYLLIPCKAKRAFGEISYLNPIYTDGEIVSSNKIYKNGEKNKFLCVYRTLDGEERRIKVKKAVVKYLVRSETKVIVAYAQNRAVVLVKKPEI